MKIRKLDRSRPKLVYIGLRVPYVILQISIITFSDDFLCLNITLGRQTSVIALLAGTKLELAFL